MAFIFHQVVMYPPFYLPQMLKKDTTVMVLQASRSYEICCTFPENKWRTSALECNSVIIFCFFHKPNILLMMGSVKYVSCVKLWHLSHEAQNRLPNLLSQLCLLARKAKYSWTVATQVPLVDKMTNCVDKSSLAESTDWCISEHRW